MNADINSPQAQAAGIKTPYPGFSGNVAQALRPFPQFQHIYWRGVPTGSSVYNALELVLEQRVTHGLQYRVSYTYSKLYNDGAENAQSGANTTLQNPVCPHTCEWGLSQDDTPNVFLASFTWGLPEAKNFPAAAGVLLGGWNVAGALRYESGRPLNIIMNNDLAGFLFNYFGQKRPNRVNGINGVTRRSGNFNAHIQSYFNPAAWEDPGQLHFGNAPRADGTVRGFPTYNEDLSIFKVFRLKDPLNMRFTATLGNVFNRTDFCDPNTNFSTGSFGLVTTQCNQPRSIQFALRFDY